MSNEFRQTPISSIGGVNKGILSFRVSTILGGGGWSHLGYVSRNQNVEF